MSRKVFISVLGTGGYKECQYGNNDFRSEPVRFVQEATMNCWKCQDWTEDDLILILLTKGAKERNWIKGKEKDGSEYDGLKARIEQMQLRAKVEGIDIEDGANEDEIMNIFLQLYDKIQEEDDLHVDLTHGFRYLPMLILVFCNYTKFLKHTTCRHLSYGNFENCKDGIAPLIDLVPLASLQEWTIASEDFISSGSTQKLKNIINERMRITRGSDEQMENVKRLTNSLDVVIGNLVTCQGKVIYQSSCFNQLQEKLDEAENMSQPFIPLIKKIDDTFSHFYKEQKVQTVENLLNGLYAADWCYNHQMYQQAITMIQETLFSLICFIADKSWSDKASRELMSCFVYIANKKNKDGTFNLNRIKPEDKPLIEQLLDKINSHPILKKITELASQCTDVRNQYNHGGMLKNTQFDADGMKKKVKKYVGDSISLVAKLDELKALREQFIQLNKPLTKSNEKIFINLSNHPSSDWGEDQIQSSKEYGVLVDLEFPQIPEDDDQEELQKVCYETLNKVNAIARKIDLTTIHIMGEMTFTYKMINLLKREGYTCVASTTKRNSVNNEDGTKTSSFEFCKFREY